VLKIDNVTKTYEKGGRVIHAADSLSWEANQGDFVVIHGPSGSGKSTLLLILGGMLPPDEGTVLFQSDNVYQWSYSRRNRYRKETIGFVFQRFFLVPYLSVLDNIRIPLSLRGGISDDGDSIEAVAKRLRIENRLNHRPAELSVGEQQRVALARGLVGGKRIILADEPTGNLDAANARIVAECLKNAAEDGCIVFMATHNESLLELGTRRLHLNNGKIVE
jgi:putative ABC transport system ATP-binding protein